MFGVSAGFVGIAHYDPTGGEWCVPDSDLIATRTWTSSDGRVWRMAHETGSGERIKSLRRRGMRLIGIGLAELEAGALWTARLPETSQDAGPAPTPAATVPSHGCGDDG